MATNVSDLVESCATVLLARKQHLDDVRIPLNALDVLAQHLVSMGCTRWWKRDEALELVRQAYPFRSLSQGEFDDVLDYLAGGGASLRRQYTEVFGKIEFEGDSFRTRPGRVQRDFLQNVGVIPMSDKCGCAPAVACWGMWRSLSSVLSASETSSSSRGVRCSSTRCRRWMRG
jgi:ATP-dependent Lhr-like helicase